MKRYGIRFCLFVTLIAAGLASISQVDAQRLPFGRTRALETSHLELADNDGPWLVMCTSFSGEDGLQQARRLAMELRTEHRLKAYIYTKTFDFRQQLSVGEGWEVVKTEDQQETIRPIQMKPLRNAKFDEVAVLVGDFSSVDDERAQKTLEKIKMLQPQTMLSEVSTGFDSPSDSDLQSLRNLKGIGFMSRNPELNNMGPMHAAFLLPNPLLPEEYFAARKVDNFVIGLNKDLKYSLLKNPGKYSVKVASFSGQTTLDLNQMKLLEQQDQDRMRSRKGITESKLVDAAKKATLLTYALRRKNIEAYEFHDRHESYVCVGSFDWLTQEDQAGLKQNNPEIEKTILEFKGESVYVPGKPGATKTYPLPAKLTAAGVTCDAQPLPVLVPKAEETKTASRFFGNFR